MAGTRPELAALSIADAPERWTALGFAVGGDGQLALGGVLLRLGGPGGGITGWTVRGLAPGLEDVDGLATGHADADVGAGAGTAVAVAGADHPNGAVGIDHVVVLTPDFDRTARALDHAGMPLRRVRDAGSFRHGFRRLGPAILELVEAGNEPPGPARFWGLVAIVPDLEALRERLHPHLGPVRPAVQPGRHIATVAAGGGLSLALAFMDPEPAPLSR